MRLTELHPEFVGHGGEHVRRKLADGTTAPVPRREGVGLGGPALEGEKPTWHRTGETFEQMTLSPSILRAPEKGGCGWHGWIRNGEVISC